MTGTSVSSNTPTLEIMHGGPFFDLQRHIGLVTPDDFRTGLRCTLLTAGTFLLPILVASMSHEGNLGSLLSDPGVWAKFLIGPIFFLMAEPMVESSINRCLGTLAKIPMVSKAGEQNFAASVQKAIARRNSIASELICMALAAAVTIINLWVLAKSASAVHWASDGTSLTPAGWVCLIIGNTVFWFLLFRLIWRHMIWIILSNGLSKSDLRLVVSHPDGHAGLSFMALYPRGYTFVSLGAGSVVAAGLARQLHEATLSLTAFTAAGTLWLCLVALFLALPLVGPMLLIVRLKSETIALTLPPIQEFERAAERKAIGRNIFADETPSETVPADARSSYQAAVKCSILLLNKTNVVPILAGALLPIAAVGLTVFPFAELGPVLKRLLLL